VAGKKSRHLELGLEYRPWGKLVKTLVDFLGIGQDMLKVTTLNVPWLAYDGPSGTDGPVK
jgi:hypothetical protein